MISEERLEKLKQIHFNHTGEMMSDDETLEMGTRLINLFRVIGRTPPESNQESDE